MLFKKNSSIDFLSIEDIKDGLLILKGNRYRAVVTADPVNFSLLSEEEQGAVEAAFISLLLSLSFPLQFFTIVKPVDVSESIEEFRERLQFLPEGMREYEKELEEFLGYFSKQTITTESYVVVPYDDTAGGYDRARSEIMRRVHMIVEGLAKCGLMPRILGTDELLELMFFVLNRDGNIRVNNLIKAGAFELYKKGVKLGAEA
ncbi:MULTISPECIES: hypothetical protein [Thermoanaerobacter]|uniref:Uncharacterized protein n=2 Tax=Thermoanaerobacter TaxID=1754 RepID=B0K834_THEP3|nr:MULTISPECIES: hypothetical protein [Thermoanaerobacter]ABY95854.1 hypothetical protein Teth39_2233 [Thermoanaerobacter pseudethanolicus ATCC 33223]ADV80777.1 hypothetical protein Thebr_2274 [Thermoanaerobacter brockii subsp. finnii Ako-1]HBW59818.1 hypothetical protein [Thermoanaerobacter sp.]